MTNEWDKASENPYESPHEQSVDGRKPLKSKGVDVVVVAVICGFSYGFAAVFESSPLVRFLMGVPLTIGFICIYCLGLYIGHNR